MPEKRNSIRVFLSLLTQRFFGRDDSEHEQAFVRLGIGTLLGFYFFYFTVYSPSGYFRQDLISLWVMGGYLAISILLILFIAISPKISPARRLIGAISDVGTITYFSFVATEYAAPLYCLYLWITIGNGFRFGNRYLFFSLALSAAGFGAAVLLLPYWVANRTLGVGLWVGMVLVVSYISTLVGRLTNALEHAEAANQAKRRFISSVSHELRTPLNAIIGMAELLHSTDLTKEQADMLHSLDNASKVMLSLIEDVLDFSKIEAGKLIIENTEFDLHQLINSTVDVFKYQATQRGLRLMTNIDPSVPFALRGDSHHIRQVLVNLLANAIKFTKKGHIVLRVDSLVQTGQSVQLRFEVEDTGIGISAEAQAKIFDSFTQADESTTRRYGGTGLGTTISKQLVELMKGKIGLRSTLGIGSLFWFELELHTQNGNIQHWMNHSLNLLLVGFDRSEALNLTNILEESNISHDAARDADSACIRLRQAAQNGKPYRILLINGSLVTVAPESGLKTEDFLKPLVKKLDDAANADVAFILCGANGLRGKEERRIAEEAGLSAVLNFPIEKRLLLNALHAADTAIPPAVESVAFDEAIDATESPHARYNILVAEDNETNRKVIHKILERAGHSCTLVQNGEEALDEIGQHDYDAIVLDMNMPVMSGLEAAKSYRFMCSADTQAPIIIFSANVTVEAKEECLEAGVDEFLPKPIQVAQFLEVLDRLITQSRKKRTVAPSRSAPPSGTLLEQPLGEDIILNYATLAELESIAQDAAFVDDLLAGFIHDSRLLLLKLEAAVFMFRIEEFREILHAMKGSAVSVGAVSLKTTCQHLERMTYSELKRDPSQVMNTIRNAFDQLYEALGDYRRNRMRNLPK